MFWSRHFKTYCEQNKICVAVSLCPCILLFNASLYKNFIIVTKVLHFPMILVVSILMKLMCTQKHPNLDDFSHHYLNDV